MFFLFVIACSPLVKSLVVTETATGMTQYHKITISIQKKDESSTLHKKLSCMIIQVEQIEHTVEIKTLIPDDQLCKLLSYLTMLKQDWTFGHVDDGLCFVEVIGEFSINKNFHTITWSSDLVSDHGSDISSRRISNSEYQKLNSLTMSELKNKSKDHVAVIALGYFLFKQSVIQLISDENLRQFLKSSLY